MISRNTTTYLHNVPDDEICGFLLAEFYTTVRHHCHMSHDHTISPEESHGFRTCGLVQSRQEDPSGKGNGEGERGMKSSKKRGEGMGI